MKSLFSHEERERKLDRIGDPLAALDATVDFQAIADRVVALLPSVDVSKGGCPPFPILLMIKLWVISSYTISPTTRLNISRWTESPCNAFLVQYPDGGICRHPGT